jgi:hypothetical protein
MSSDCTSIAVPLSLRWQMKTPSKTRTAGALTRPAGRSAGRWCRNGSGTRLLELGHQLEPTPIRITEFAPALPPPSPHTAPPSGYALPHVGLPWKAGRFSGQDFALQADGTLRCPADQRLSSHEQRREADGSLRVVYGASIRSCRPCPLREQCQWQGSATAKPRQVSVLLLHGQRVDVHLEQTLQIQPETPAPLFSRAQRAHYRLSWAERLARNARGCSAPGVAITLFGVPGGFAAFLGLSTV